MRIKETIIHNHVSKIKKEQNSPHPVFKETIDGQLRIILHYVILRFPGPSGLRPCIFAIFLNFK